MSKRDLHLLLGLLGNWGTELTNFLCSSKNLTKSFFRWSWYLHSSSHSSNKNKCIILDGYFITLELVWINFFTNKGKSNNNNMVSILDTFKINFVSVVIHAIVKQFNRPINQVFQIQHFHNCEANFNLGLI